MFMKILCLGASTVLFMFMSAGCGSSGNDNKGGGTASVDSGRHIFAMTTIRTVVTQEHMNSILHRLTAAL
jgi:hypothetical protein